MTSKDYKERFKAEYYQLKIRYEKLDAMIKNWDNLSFEPWILVLHILVFLLWII